MIRINLLGVERQKKARAIALDIGQRLTLACSLVLVITAGLLGWWYWSLTQTSAQVDTDIASAQQEVARLQSVIREVELFEQQRTALQQRVALIERLRSGQSIPVQLLDHVSRSLPDMLWLTQMDYKDNAATIEGRSTTLIGVSDFVGNLAGNPLLQKPVELLSSQVEAVNAVAGTPAAAAVDLIRFTVKAQLAVSTPPLTVPPAAGRGAQ